MYDALNCFWEEMKNIVQFTLSVGGTTRVVYNKYWAGQTKLVTLNTIFNVVYISTMLLEIQLIYTLTNSLARFGCEFGQQGIT